MIPTCYKPCLGLCTVRATCRLLSVGLAVSGAAMELLHRPPESRLPDPSGHHPQSLLHQHVSQLGAFTSPKVGHIPTCHSHPQRSATSPLVIHIPRGRPHPHLSFTSPEVGHIPTCHSHPQRSATSPLVIHIPRGRPHPHLSFTSPEVGHIPTCHSHPGHIPTCHSHPQRSATSPLGRPHPHLSFTSGRPHPQRSATSPLVIHIPRGRPSLLVIYIPRGRPHPHLFPRGRPHHIPRGRPHPHLSFTIDAQAALIRQSVGCATPGCTVGKGNQKHIPRRILDVIARAIGWSCKMW